jgi:hypothetical protein
MSGEGSGAVLKPDDAWKWELQPGECVDDLRGSRYRVAGSMRLEAVSYLLPVIAAGDERVTHLRAEHLRGRVDEEAEQVALEERAIEVVEELSRGESVYFGSAESLSRDLYARIVEHCLERGFGEPAGSMDSDMEGCSLWIRRDEPAPPPPADIVIPPDVQRTMLQRLARRLRATAE